MNGHLADGTKTCPYCAEEIKAAAVVCKHCGSKLDTTPVRASSTEHKFHLGRCIRCGMITTDPLTFRTPCKPAGPPVDKVAHAPPHTEPSEVSAGKLLRCPRCSSTQLTAQKQGFGLGKAVIGGVLTGGVGLLAGFVGSGKIKVTCLQCGHAWKPGK